MLPFVISAGDGILETRLSLHLNPHYWKVPISGKYCQPPETISLGLMKLIKIVHH